MRRSSRINRMWPLARHSRWMIKDDEVAHGWSKMINVVMMISVGWVVDDGYDQLMVMFSSYVGSQSWLMTFRVKMSTDTLLGTYSLTLPNGSLEDEVPRVGYLSGKVRGWTWKVVFVEGIERLSLVQTWLRHLSPMFGNGFGESRYDFMPRESWLSTNLLPKNPMS